MKKQLSLLIGATIFISSYSIAQPNEIKDSPIMAYNTIRVHDSAFGYLNDLNINAARSFGNDFKDATGEKWTKKQDGYRVTYDKDNIKYLIDYDKKGKWNSTIRIYGEKQLPEDVRRNIKTTYFDYNIITVSELKINKVLSYFIKIEDEKTLKTIRVIDNNIEVVEDYVK